MHLATGQQRIEHYASPLKVFHSDYRETESLKNMPTESNISLMGFVLHDTSGIWLRIILVSRENV